MSVSGTRPAQRKTRVGRTVGVRETLVVRAFAKINLDLQVIGVRSDGYHELRTTFQSIALHDVLSFQKTRGPFRIECDDPACPIDRRNLVWRAAELMWRAAGRRGAPRGVTVRIAKRIPMQGGLGGGSSDGAAALRAFASIWRVPISDAELSTKAAKLGADVPYFLDGGTALGLDRGDCLYPLVDGQPAWVVLVVPPFGVSTNDAFGWWDSAGTRREAKRGRHDEMRNDLQTVVASRHPILGRLIGALRRSGARHAALSGSGSATFGLFDRRADALRAARLVSVGRGRTIVTRTLTRAAYQTLAAK